MKVKRLFLSGMLLALALVSTACGIASVSTEGGELVIEVNMSEDQVNRLINGSLINNEGDDFLFTEVSSVDLMEPNIIRVAGSMDDGTSGTYDMTIDVVDRAIKIEVVAVDVPGVTMDDPRVQAGNDELAAAFLENVRSDADDSGMSEVAVVDDELVFTITAPLD